MRTAAAERKHVAVGVAEYRFLGERLLRRRVGRLAPLAVRRAARARRVRARLAGAGVGAVVRRLDRLGARAAALAVLLLLPIRALLLLRRAGADGVAGARSKRSA